MSWTQSDAADRNSVFVLPLELTFLMMCTSVHGPFRLMGAMEKKIDFFDPLETNVNFLLDRNFVLRMDLSQFRIDVRVAWSEFPLISHKGR